MCERQVSAGLSPRCWVTDVVWHQNESVTTGLCPRAFGNARPAQACGHGCDSWSQMGLKISQKSSQQHCYWQKGSKSLWFKHKVCNSCLGEKIWEFTPSHPRGHSCIVATADCTLSVFGKGMGSIRRTQYTKLGTKRGSPRFWVNIFFFGSPSCVSVCVLLLCV